MILSVLVIDPTNLQATRRTITDKINCAPQRLSFWPVTKIMGIYFRVVASRNLFMHV